VDEAATRGLGLVGIARVASFRFVVVFFSFLSFSVFLPFFSFLFFFFLLAKKRVVKSGTDVCCRMCTLEVCLTTMHACFSGRIIITQQAEIT